MPDLLPFQKIGVEYLRAGRKRLLADDPGLGKTVQLLSALPERAAVVVTCPAPLKEVWQDFAAVWAPAYKVTVIYGRNAFRMPEHGEIVVVNYEILPQHYDQGAPAGLHILADEVHATKNPSADRTKSFRQLRSLALSVGGVVWGATGTPLYNKPLDLWNTLASLDLHLDVFGRYSQFVHLFRGFETKFGMKWGTPRGEVVSMLARHVLGRRREDVLSEMPEKMYSTIRVDIDHSRIPDWEERNRSGHSPGISKARETLARHKARAALSALKEMASVEPLVVFSWHRGAVEEVAAALDVPAAIGQEDVKGLVDKFQEGKIDHFVGTIAAAGTGFTLIRASCVVFIDRDWTIAMNTQAEDRVCRIGQSRGVRVVDVITDHPLDNLVRRTLMGKALIDDESVEAMKEFHSENGV